MGQRVVLCAQRLTASEGWISTRIIKWTSLPKLSAQRLTASEGWISLHVLRVDLAYQVLNALRHQRVGSVVCRLPASTRTSCAQRLTASEGWISQKPGQLRKFSNNVLNALRHQRVGSDRWAYGALGAIVGAQRLTASEGWIRLLFLPCFSQNVSVLNALRHQRVGSAYRLEHRGVKLRCSTPYGIRGLDQSTSISTRIYTFF